MKLGNAAGFQENCGLRTLPWSVHLKQLTLVTVSFRQVKVYHLIAAELKLASEAICLFCTSQSAVGSGLLVVGALDSYLLCLMQMTTNGVRHCVHGQFQVEEMILQQLSWLNLTAGLYESAFLA